MKRSTYERWMYDLNSGQVVASTPVTVPLLVAQGLPDGLSLAQFVRIQKSWWLDTDVDFIDDVKPSTTWFEPIPETLVGHHQRLIGLRVLWAGKLALLSEVIADDLRAAYFIYTQSKPDPFGNCFTLEVTYSYSVLDEANRAHWERVEEQIITEFMRLCGCDPEAKR